MKHGALIRIFNQDSALLEVGVPSMRLYFAAFFAMWMRWPDSTASCPLARPSRPPSC